jgi:hypothetical protein
VTDVFISYTREERPRCAAIADKLRALGLNVWFDAKLASGTSFDHEIEQNIRAARAVMVLWSPRSVKSSWVRNEATIGQQRDVLVSVEIEPCTVPVNFTNTHSEFLHDPKFGDNDPAWTNILARLANLTSHPSLARYRDLEPQATRRRGKFPMAAAIVALLVVAGGAGAWWITNNNQGAPIETAEAASVAVDPEVDQLARLVVGQWAISRSDCPPHITGQPVDMTPSTGAWFTMQYEAGSIRASSGGTTVIERIVGVQNGWLRTTSSGDDLFYRVDEAGRLLLRVGSSEPTRLEPCI